MQLTNFWLPLIWVLTAGAFFELLVPRQKVYVLGEPRMVWSRSSIIILSLPLIFWAAFRSNQFGDTGMYRSTFRNSTPGSLSQAIPYMLSSSKDRGFALLRVIIKWLTGGNDILYFLLIAAFQILLLFSIYRKYSSNVLISITLFIISTDYIAWVFNGMRQFIAAVGIFACTGLMLKKKYIPLILLILLYSTIHGSAILMLPIVFIAQGSAWNKKTLLFIILIILSVVFLDRFMNILDIMTEETQYAGTITNEIWVNDDGTNVFRALVYSVPAIASLFGKVYIDRDNNPVINLCVNMSIFSSGFYVIAIFTSGIYVGRIPIYMSLYSYILLPWLIERMFTERSQKFVYIIMFGLYFLFFYYQMHFIWGLL